MQFQPLTILYSLNPVFNHEPSENLSLLNFRCAHVFTRGILDKIEPFPSVLVSTPPVDGLLAAPPVSGNIPALFSLPGARTPVQAPGHVSRAALAWGPQGFGIGLHRVGRGHQMAPAHPPQAPQAPQAPWPSRPNTPHHQIKENIP